MQMANCYGDSISSVIGLGDEIEVKQHLDHLLDLIFASAPIAHPETALTRTPEASELELPAPFPGDIHSPLASRLGRPHSY